MTQENELRLLRKAQTAWISGLAERLNEKNISFEIRAIPNNRPNHRFGTEMKCEIYVSADDWEQAREVDQAFYSEQIPETNADQTGAMLDIEHCPACGAELNGKEESCPDCGLGFISNPEV